MGGKLFNFGRLPRPEYLRREAELRAYLDRRFGDHYRIPRYYGDKPDFGDMDIILNAAAAPDGRAALFMEIVKELGIEEYKLRKHLLSTNYKQFQVDFFFAEPEVFLSTWQFLCYNDLGNLLGKIFRRFNLKYGEQGLSYVFRRQDGHYKKDILISRYYPKILAFLGLEFERWEQGFANLEELFEWVIQCAYFSVEPYLEMAAITEKRARQRTTIRKFIDYISEKGISKRYEYEEDRDRYLPMIIGFFPEARLEEALAAEREAEEKALIIREKFNGKIIMKMFPKLKGETLGAFIMAFKQSFDNFESEVMAMTAEAVRARIAEFFEEQPKKPD